MRSTVLKAAWHSSKTHLVQQYSDGVVQLAKEMCGLRACLSTRSEREREERGEERAERREEREERVERGERTGFKGRVGEWLRNRQGMAREKLLY